MGASKKHGLSRGTEKKTVGIPGSITKKENFLECSRKTHVELGLGGHQKNVWFGSFNRPPVRYFSNFLEFLGRRNGTF